jgi:hypothetical protein
MSMINPYYYLYYRLYKFAKKVGTGDASWTAILLITVLIALNVFSLLFAFIDKYWIFILPAKLVGVLIAVTLGFINYFIFSPRKKTQAIISRFEGESKQASIIGSIAVLIYIALSWRFAH